MLQRRLVNGRNLPLFETIGLARLEPFLLLVLRDVEVIFPERDAVAREHRLERHDHLEEGFHIPFAAEAHHALDAGAVVPGAVEDHELLRRGEEGDETLEVPFRRFTAGGFARRVHARFAWAHMSREPLDRAVLTRAI